MKIEHLGIAIQKFRNLRQSFSKNWENSYKQESVEREGVTTFLSIRESKIELLEATNPESPIAKFIDKKRRREFNYTLFK